MINPNDNLDINATTHESLAFAEVTMYRAQANHVLALSNSNNFWPWRWLRWWRVTKAVEAELQAVRHRMKQQEAWHENYETNTSRMSYPV